MLLAPFQIKLCLSVTALLVDLTWLGNCFSLQADLLSLSRFCRPLQPETSLMPLEAARKSVVWVVSHQPQVKSLRCYQLCDTSGAVRSAFTSFVHVAAVTARICPTKCNFSFLASPFAGLVLFKVSVFFSVIR